MRVKVHRSVARQTYAHQYRGQHVEVEPWSNGIHPIEDGWVSVKGRPDEVFSPRDYVVDEPPERII